MSLNMFWFLPTHGDGHYLGTEEGYKIYTRLQEHLNKLRKRRIVWAIPVC